MKTKSLMFTAVAAICFAAASFLAVDANYGKDLEKDLLTKNLEALTNDEVDDSGWAIGFRTGQKDYDGVKVLCCIKSESTDACNFDEVGCISTSW